MVNLHLIINFLNYFPMGSLGVCDYLHQRGVSSKILNLDDNNELQDGIVKIINVIDELKPTHITLLLHWKEAVCKFEYYGKFIRSKYSYIKIIASGFTAAYFKEDFLKTFGFIDYLIVGDPEYPLFLLLHESKEDEDIPNIIFRDRDSGKIINNKRIWHISSEELSSFSFAKLDYVYDYEKYLSVVDEFAGFPIFIGRGCPYNCLFCGGSEYSFRSHSNFKDKSNIVFRNVDAILTDLLFLKKYVKRIYIGYDTNIAIIEELLLKISRNKEIKNHFNVVYSSWSLPTKRMIFLLKDAFSFDNNIKSSIEISPEVFSEKSRRVIRDSRLFYTNEQLLFKISELRNIIGDNIKIELFYSRYHFNQSDYNGLKKEFADIVDLRYFLSKKYKNIFIYYMHLSTDVASYYWDKYIFSPNKTTALIKEISKINDSSINYNNYCFFKNENLKESDLVLFEKLIAIDSKIIQCDLFETIYSKLNQVKYLDFLESIMNITDYRLTKNIISEKFVEYINGVYF